jgi:hypothetical protein
MTHGRVEMSRGAACRHPAPPTAHKKSRVPTISRGIDCHGLLIAAIAKSNNTVQ